MNPRSLPTEWLPLKASDLALQIENLSFENQDATDSGEGHPFAGEYDYAFNVSDLLTRVPTLATARAGRLDDRFGIESPEECRLHIQHVCNLAHGVERRVVVVERERCHCWPFIASSHAAARGEGLAEPQTLAASLGSLGSGADPCRNPLLCADLRRDTLLGAD